MRRLIDQESKQILPHHEETEVVNLGNNEERSKNWYNTVDRNKEGNNRSPP